MEGLLEVEKVMELLSIKKAKAYALIRQLNKELASQGFIVFQGRVPAKYLKERCCL